MLCLSGHLGGNLVVAHCAVVALLLRTFAAETDAKRRSWWGADRPAFNVEVSRKFSRRFGACLQDFRRIACDIAIYQFEPTYSSNPTALEQGEVTCVTAFCDSKNVT